MSRVTIDVAQIEFEEGGNTLWIHNSNGLTVLRLKFEGGIHSKAGCENLCAHADAFVAGSLAFCMPDAAPNSGQ